MTLKKLIALLVAAAGIAVLQAGETVYKTAWVQDFEDVETYTRELKQGSIASAVLVTTEATPGDLSYTVHQGPYEFVDSGTVQCQISNEERTAYDGTTGHCLRGVMRGSTSANLMFMMPEEATTATDYLVEFDHFLGASYSNGSNVSSNGFAIVGAKGVLASFAIGPVYDKGPYTVGVFRGGDPTDVLTTAIVTGSRGQVDVAAYWMHVSVRGTSEGVFLSVENADGRKMAEVKLQDEFDVVSSIYFRNTAKQYKHGFSIDDVKVSLPAADAVYVWTGAAGDRLWSNPANWIVGEAVPLAMPTEVDEVVIPENQGAVYVDPAAVYKTLTIGAGSSLALLVKDVIEERAVFTLPKLKDGSTLSDEQVIVCGPYEKGVSEDGSAITAVRVPSTFVWSVDQGAWQLASNWRVGGLVSGDVPGEEDQIVFPTTAALTVNTTSMTVSNAWVDADAVLTVSGNKYLHALMFNGEGSLRLNGGLLGNPSMSHAVISNNIEIVEGTVNDILVGNGGGCQISFYGNLTGAGSLRIDEAGQNGAGLNFYSEDNSGFSGSVEVYRTLSSAIRSNTRFFSAGATSANATWKLRGNSSANIFLESNKTYYFGALNNGVWEQSSYSGITLEIGSRNEDCSFSGSLSRYDDKDHRNYGTTIRKVGTAKLTIDTTNTGTVEINGGTFVFAKSDALPHANEFGDYWIQFGGGTLETTAGVDPSALIKKSTSPISVSVVDAEANETWASVLESSNEGGLIKKGAGTLTLAKVPVYTGVTTVEAGELVVPEGSRIHWDILSAGTLTGAQPTSYDYQVGTTNVYNSAATVPSAGNHTLNLDNLLAIDLTSVTTVEKNSKFVIAAGKAFNVGGKAIGKAGRENIELIWGKDTVFPNGKTAADYTLQVVNGQLVVANKAVGMAIIIR